MQCKPRGFRTRKTLLQTTNCVLLFVSALKAEEIAKSQSTYQRAPEAVQRYSSHTWVPPGVEGNLFLVIHGSIKWLFWKIPPLRSIKRYLWLRMNPGRVKTQQQSLSYWYDNLYQRQQFRAACLTYRALGPYFCVWLQKSESSQCKNPKLIKTKEVCLRNHWNPRTGLTPWFLFKTTDGDRLEFCSLASSSLGQIHLKTVLSCQQVAIKIHGQNHVIYW